MKKYNSVKNILLFISVATSILFVGCLKDEDPSKARLDPGSINSELAMEAIVAGMYRQFTAANEWGFCWERSYGADDITAHSGWNKQGYRSSDQMVMTPLTDKLGFSYTPFYATIREANNIIENGKNMTAQNSRINYFIGEALFLRAYCYFHLVRSFGKVPLILSTDIAENENLKKAEIIDIYKQIEQDFLEAEKLLPSKYPGVPAAIRPNNGSARALLAKVYMHWAGWPLKDNTKYLLAANSAKKVIDEATIHGFGLVTDLKSLWSTKDEYRFNEEMVFGIGHYSNLLKVYGNKHAGRVGYPRSVGGWSEVFPEYTFFNEFPAGPRRDATFRTTVIYNNNTLQWQDLKDNSEGKNEVHPLYFKVTGFQEEIAINNSSVNISTYIMRYSDLLLLYAEAVGRSGGNNTDAWEMLNKVRRRAYGYDINTTGSPADINSGDLAELAYTERKWELAGEFQRWDDLTRMERVAEALSKRAINEPCGPIIGSTSPSNYFAPLPQSEIDKAPQLGE